MSHYSRSSTPNAEVRLCSNIMADDTATATAMIALTASAATAFLSTTLSKQEDPERVFGVKYLDKFLLKFPRFFLENVLFILGAVLGYFLCEMVTGRYMSHSSDEADHNKAKSSPEIDKVRWGNDLQAMAHPDKATRKELKGNEAQFGRWADAYGAQHERLQQSGAELRDSQRIIQSQTTALERSEHRADAAERNLRAKNNTIEIQSTLLETKDSKIQDLRDIIALQAQQIKDSHFDLEAMAQQNGERDQRLWEAAGSLTVAEKEIAKLKTAVAEEYTTSDYCCALNAIHQRDETIGKLEKKIAQQAKDNEFNQETVDTLANLLISLEDKEPGEVARELEAWAEEREARFDDFVAHTGPVVIAAQQDASQHLRDTNDLQQKLLKSAVEARDRQGKTAAELMAQLAALVAREEHNIKIYDQMKGEKQHLLNALNNSQNSLQAARTELYRRGTELASTRTELSHHMLQQVIDEKKAKIASNASIKQENKLAALTEQLATANTQLQAAEEHRVQEVALMNHKLRMVREALKITGLDIDLWTIESPDVLASMLQHEEAKLAETCAELTATNNGLHATLAAQAAEIANLNTKLTSQAIEVTALKTDLKAATARHHCEFKEWQATLSKVTTELKITKRDSPAHELENKINALQIRLKVSDDENKSFREAKYHAEEKAEILTMAVTNQAERLKKSREEVERVVKAEQELRGEVGVRVQQIGYLSARLEEERDARRGEQGEMKRLTGLLECREEEVRELEGAREKLEEKLLLGEEFVEVTEEDAPAAAVERAEEEEGFVVQEEEVELDCFADDFEEVDVDEEQLDCFSDEFEEVDIDEDGEGLDTLNGAPDVRVQ